MENEGYYGVAPIIVGGIVAGITTATVTNPIWVIKTRMQTQVLSSPNKSAHYTGVIGTRLLVPFRVTWALLARMNSYPIL